MDSITESESYFKNLHEMSVSELLTGMNQEDKTVPYAVEKAMPQIEALINALVPRMKAGGRLFYIGAGTSGRLGIVDASECPPTFGVNQGVVVGLIAGGDRAIRKAVEFAEDDPEQAWKDLEEYQITANDSLIGIAASGTTPYVVGGVQRATAEGLVTGCITCNPETPLARAAGFPVEVVVGPEFVTGSTRMKAGTAQKLVLNMITTTTMIQLGHVVGNKMVDMQIANNKLVERGTRMLMQELEIDKGKAEKLLQLYGSVRRVISEIKKGNAPD